MELSERLFSGKLSSRTRSPFRDVIGSTVMRSVLLPVSGLASLAASFLVVGSVGTAGFALFSIFIALPAMVPLSDFGLSVAVTDAAARDGIDSWQFRMVWRKTLILLVSIGATTVALGIGVALFQGWHLILGVPEGGNSELAGVVIMSAMALGIPLGTGQRVLLGAGRQTIATTITSASPLLSVGFVALASVALPPTYVTLAIAYSMGPFVAQGTLFIMAWRLSRGSGIPPRGPELANKRTLGIGRAAWPMALMSVSLPLAYQSDRVILAHTAGIDAVGQYSLASTLYMPLLSIITIGSLALWPLFLKQSKAAIALKSDYHRATWLFTILGIALAIGLVTIGPWLSSVIYRGNQIAPLDVYAVFGLVLIAFAFNAPAGMYLMDYSGRVFQACGSLLLLACKIPLSMVLVQPLGISGVLVGTLVPMLVFMVVPTRILSSVRLRQLENAS